jgi:hypothetical protein
VFIIPISPGAAKIAVAQNISKLDISIFHPPRALVRDIGAVRVRQLAGLFHRQINDAG